MTIMIGVIVTELTLQIISKANWNESVYKVLFYAPGIDCPREKT